MSFAPHARRAGAVASLSALAVVGSATAASAHVTANPDSAEQGSYAKVAFRVPNERDNASTVKVVVHLPAEHPLSSVSVRPTPGWKVKVEKAELPKPIEAHGATITEAVSTITWSGGEIEPGQFQEFDVSMGQLPTNTDQMVFKADQTYSNDEVVKWEEPPVEGGAEPEHPAPVLGLVPEGGAETAGLTAQKKPAEPAEASGDGTARLLGGLGIAVGVIGAGIGGLGLTRARSRS